jgi:hypothetical protein
VTVTSAPSRIAVSCRRRCAFDRSAKPARPAPLADPEWGALFVVPGSRLAGPRDPAGASRQRSGPNRALVFDSTAAAAIRESPAESARTHRLAHTNGPAHRRISGSRCAKTRRDLRITGPEKSPLISWCYTRHDVARPTGPGAPRRPSEMATVDGIWMAERRLKRYRRTAPLQSCRP